MPSLNEAIARKRGWYVGPRAGMALPTLDSASLGDVEACACETPRDRDGWPDYERDARLWSRLLQEMDSPGLYQSSASKVWTCDGGPRLTDTQSAMEIGRAVCLAWCAANEVEHE